MNASFLFPQGYEHTNRIAELEQVIADKDKLIFDQQAKIYSLEASIFVLNTYLERATKQKEALEEEISSLTGGMGLN